MSTLSIQSISFTSKGKKAENEDYVFPEAGEICKNENLYVLCDGNGGEEGGFIAAQITTNALVNEFKTENKQSIREEDVEKALAVSLQDFQKQFEQNPQLGKMGCTLTLIHIGANKLTFAHIGDSRIYHFRKGEILNYSPDHSLVWLKVLNGTKTAEWARKAPNNNILLKTHRLRKEGEMMSLPEYLINPIATIAPGDFFFLCSDGVIEAFSNEELSSEIFSSGLSIHERVEKLISKCNELSEDNFSGIVIEILENENYDKGLKLLHYHEKEQKSLLDKMRDFFD